MAASKDLARAWQRRAEVLEISLDAANTNYAMLWAEKHERQTGHHCRMEYPFGCLACDRHPARFGTPILEEPHPEPVG